MKLQEIVVGMRGRTALVIGDPMVDLYHFGRVTKLSQEAPVPVFVTEHSEERPGGASNVAANLKALGLTVRTIYPDPPWTRKTRYMAGRHQVFRVDADHTGSIRGSALADLHLPGLPCDVIVLSDYAKGAITPYLARLVIDYANGNHIPVVVDPKTPNWDHFAGATVICPNEEEYHAHLHSEDSPHRGFDWIIEKRGPEGLRVIPREGSVEIYPATARHVYDVTGAGDTVVATVAAAIAAGATVPQAAQLAVRAAGQVVEEVGTAVPHVGRLWMEAVKLQRDEIPAKPEDWPKFTLAAP